MQCIDRGNQLIFRSGNVIVEQHVADRAGRRSNRLDVLHRCRGDVCRRQHHATRSAGAGVLNDESMAFPGARGEQPCIQHGNSCRCIVIGHVHAIDREHQRTSRNIYAVAGVDIRHQILPRWRCLQCRPFETISD